MKADQRKLSIQMSLKLSKFGNHNLSLDTADLAHVATTSRRGDLFRCRKRKKKVWSGPSSLDGKDPVDFGIGEF